MYILSTEGDILTINDDIARNNVVAFNHPDTYEFVMIPVWLDWHKLRDGSVVKKQVASIGLRKKDLDIHIIHPVSNFILNWKWRSSEYNTQRKHANNLVKFLNFLLENRHMYNIASLTDLNITIGNTYLNSLTNNELRRDTILDAGRTLTYFYLWLSNQDCLPHVDKKTIENKKMHNPHNGRTYYDSIFNPILPSRTTVKRKHLFPVKYIPLLFEIAILFAHPIAFGLYLQIFGGLRIGEVVNLKRTSFRKRMDSADFLIHIRERQFRTDIKDSSGSNYVKKIRNQLILQIKDWGDILYRDHVEFYKDKDEDGTGALFLNRDGKPMTAKSYSQYFYKVKDKFIKFLKDYGSIEDKVVAADLQLSNWATHICRGTFTNLIAEEIENPAELMFLRGDSNLLSCLPYLANTDRVRRKVEERMNHMHTDYVPRLIERRNEFE
jgi:hypothetical protein